MTNLSHHAAFHHASSSSHNNRDRKRPTHWQGDKIPGRGYGLEDRRAGGFGPAQLAAWKEYALLQETAAFQTSTKALKAATSDGNDELTEDEMTLLRVSRPCLWRILSYLHPYDDAEPKIAVMVFCSVWKQYQHPPPPQASKAELLKLSRQRRQTTFKDAQRVNRRAFAIERAKEKSAKRRMKKLALAQIQAEAGKRPCSACHVALPKSAYSKAQWKKGGDLRRCTACVADADGSGSKKSPSLATSSAAAHAHVSFLTSSKKDESNTKNSQINENQNQDQHQDQQEIDPATETEHRDERSTSPLSNSRDESTKEYPREETRDNDHASTCTEEDESTPHSEFTKIADASANKFTELEEKGVGTIPIIPKVVPFNMMDDYDTRLERLNTIRLYKRIKHYRAHPETYAGFEPYKRGLDTDDLASEEWSNLVNYVDEMEEYQYDCNIARKKGKKIMPNLPVLPPRPPPSTLVLATSACLRAPTTLASYPRSGSSFCRTLFERSFMYLSGTDSLPVAGTEKTYGTDTLLGNGLVKECNTHLVSTHFPARMGNCEYEASRVILLVRNPFDAISSFIDAQLHGLQYDTAPGLSQQQREQTRKQWEVAVLKEFKVWKGFHEYWLDKGGDNIPVMLIRYEDLVRYPAAVTDRILDFTIEEERKSSFYEAQIEYTLSEEELEKLGSRRPTIDNIGKFFAKFSPALLQQIADTGVLEIMKRVGYPIPSCISELTNADAYVNIKPFRKYAIVWDVEGARNPLININDDEDDLVRTTELNTDWVAERKAVGYVCNCAQCFQARKAAAAAAAST